MASDWLVYTSSFPQTILLHLLYFVTMWVFGGFQKDSFCSNRCQRRGTLVLIPTWGHMGIGFSLCKNPQQSSCKTCFHSFLCLYPPKFLQSYWSTVVYWSTAAHVLFSESTSLWQYKIARVKLSQLYNHNSGQTKTFVKSDHFCFWNETH